MLERRAGLRNEQRIVGLGGAQRLDEWRINRVVVCDRVAATASATVPGKSFPEENVCTGANIGRNQAGHDSRVLGACLLALRGRRWSATRGAERLAAGSIALHDAAAAAAGRAHVRRKIGRASALAIEEAAACIAQVGVRLDRK